MCCNWLKVRHLHIKKSLSNICFAREFVYKEPEPLQSKASQQQSRNYLNFFCISCSCSFSNFISRSRRCHFRGLLDMLNVLQSCCIFTGEALALKEFIFRWHNELHGIWSHGGPALSCSLSLFSINFRWSLETLRTWVLCLNVSSSIYWCLSRSHPQMGHEVNGMEIELWIGAAMMLNSQGRGWHCPATWSIWAVLLEDHQVTVCWGRSQGCLELALRNFLADTAPGVITKLV